MNSLNSDYEYISAAELARMVRNKQISPLEITNSAIKSIQTQNLLLNAFVYLDVDGARKRARILEAQIMNKEEVGPLAGVPTAMKDLFNFYPGWPSTYGGIRPLRNFALNLMSAFPQRLEAADALIMGSTNSSAMGFRGTCDNLLFGPTCNPFDLARNSGGSSGGSAAAVASGMIPFAQGTDGGGSIRIPSAWCGVFGFQPSFGRIPKVMPSNPSKGLSLFIYEGPIARTVEDAALALTAICSSPVTDSVTHRESSPWMTALKTSIQGKKIGFSPNLGVFPVDPRVTSLVAQAVNAFENQGAHVIDLEIALTYSHQELSDLWCQIMAGNFGAVLDLSKQHGIDLLRDHPKELPTLLLEWMNKAHKRTLAQKLYVQHIQEKVFTAFEEAFSEVDFIVSPTVACLPVLNGEGGDTLGPSKLNGETINPLIGWCLTYFTNFTGHPSASVPAGLIDGLPVGLQVIGRRQADFDLLAACARFEEARPWKQIYKDIRKRALKANCQYSPGTLGTPNKVTLGQ